ncbi:hypothetical protein A2U01_0052773, partial [Trifolium medium]|nr:hypothetical protein [Trifolium medium]
VKEMKNKSSKFQMVEEGVEDVVVETVVEAEDVVAE